MLLKPYPAATLLVCVLLAAPAAFCQEEPPPAEQGAIGPELGPAPLPPAGEQPRAQLPAGVIAMVNGEPIYAKEWVDNCVRVAGESILSVMVRHMVVRQAAQKTGIQVTDAEAQIEYDKAVTEAGGPDELAARLKDMGVAVADFKNRLRTEALLRKLVEKNVQVSDEDVRKLYLEQYGRKAEVQVIVTQTQPDAQTVVNQAREGKDFAQLGMEYSTDEYTRENHSYLPAMLSEGFFPKQFGKVVVTENVAETVFALKVGEVSNVVPAGDAGFYVFKLTAFQPAKDVSFDTVKDEVRRDAEGIKMNRIAGEYLDQLLKSSQIDVRMGVIQ